MRIARFGLFGTLLLGSVACQSGDGGVTNTNVPPLAFVRYINGVPDSVSFDSVNVLVDPVTLIPDSSFFTTTHTTTVRFTNTVEYAPQAWANVAFRGLGVGGYQGLLAGSRSFKVFTFDPLFFSTNQLVDTTFSFTAGTYYTIVHTRNGGASFVQIMQDDLPAASAQVQYRVGHMAVGQGALDFYQTAAANSPIAGTPAAANVALHQRSPYMAVATGALAAQITATGDVTSLAGTLSPAGTAGTTAADPIGGHNIAGTVMSAYAFGGAPAVSFLGRQFRAAINPAIAWYTDRQPPRTTP